jgi:uncharacterized protein YfaS (alpha-2-macroglobulin family)
VHFKLIARADTPNGVRLLAPGTKVEIALRDSQAKELDTRTIDLNAWSSAEWTFKVPAEAPLGTYSVVAKTEKHVGQIYGDFLVAAYRRPDFRVDVSVDSNSTVAGTKLNGRINGRYLFGAPMDGAPVAYVFEDRGCSTSRKRSPTAGRTHCRSRTRAGVRLAVVGPRSNRRPASSMRRAFSRSARHAERRRRAVRIQTRGVVTDVTRQEIAGRASFRVDPAPWYIGLQKPPFFADTNTGVDTAVIAAGLDGLAVAGVNVEVSLKRLQWTSVRQSEGEGFYNWESERKEVDVGEWTVTTKTEPAPLHIPLTEGGEYLLIATADDGDGRSTTTASGSTPSADYAWERYDLIASISSRRPTQAGRDRENRRSSRRGARRLS